MGDMDQEVSLSSLFDQALEIHQDIFDSHEDTSSEPFQNKVKKGILMLEDATRLVSVLDIFSRNENYSELPTGHLKFFLLPVLLGNYVMICIINLQFYMTMTWISGDLNNKVIEAVRDGVVEIVQVYYIDYLQRCQDYGFNIDHIPKLVKVKADDEYGDVEDVPRPPDMGKMTAERNAKMERFRRSKQLESDLGKLKKVLAAVVSGAAADEDVLRDYYLKLIQKSVYTSLDELASLEMEVGVLRHMAKLKAGQIAPEPERQRRKLQPIIIAKDQFQKEVYGLGYPSLPVLSVDEFYEKRIEEGWWKPPSSGGALQDRANDPDLEARMKEEEAREEDDKVDRDNEEARERVVRMDEYKDEHRRGEGNRHNMG